MTDWSLPSGRRRVTIDRHDITYDQIRHVNVYMYGRPTLTLLHEVFLLCP